MRDREFRVEGFSSVNIKGIGYKYGDREEYITFDRIASALNNQQAAEKLAEALKNVSYTADFGNGEEMCWCAEGFHNSMPDDSEPDFHSTACKEAREALALYEGVK